MLSVLFVGSCEETSRDYPKFVAFCRSLGAATCERFRILIAGTVPRTADCAIALGALDALSNTDALSERKARIILYHTSGDESETTEGNELFSKIIDLSKTSTRVRSFADPELAFKQAIKDCDVVAVIGGGDISRGIVNQAIELKKPVLGFTRFDGEGGRAYAELRRVYQLLEISEETASSLNEREINGLTAQSFHQLVKDVHERNPWSAVPLIQSRLLYSALILIPATLLYWCWLQGEKGAPFFLFSPESFKWLGPICILSGIIGGMVRYIITATSSIGARHAQALGLMLGGLGSGLTFGGFILGFLHVVIGPEIVKEVPFTNLFWSVALIPALLTAFDKKGIEVLEFLFHSAS